MSEKKDLEVKYREKKEKPEVIAKIDEAFNVETRYAIIMAINTFGSSNIKKLAGILGKNEATIFHHIKELTKEPALIQIDQETTHSHKGIFYKLTDLSKKHFCDVSPEKIEDIFKKVFKLFENRTDEEIAKFYFDLMAKNPDIAKGIQQDRRRLAYNHILENFMITNMERIEQALKEGKKPKNKQYPIGSISIDSIDMHITTPRQLFEILEVIAEMYSKLGRLKEKFVKENEKAGDDNERIAVHYHTIGGEVAEFNFE